MLARLDFAALKKSRSAAILHRSLRGVNFDELKLSELVKLKALFLQVIQKDNFRSVSDDILITYTSLLSDRPLDLPPLEPGRSKVRHVTILFPNLGSSGHLSALSNFVSFLVSMKSLERVDVVFSGELAPAVWQGGEAEKHKAMATELMHSAIADLHASPEAPPELLSKLRITVAPEVEELAGAIGEVVIRYEGTVPSIQFRMCSRSIFKQRPVLATVGTSVVADVPDIDVLLTPSNRDLEDREMHYLRPLPRFPDDPKRLKFCPPADGRLILLSGYNNDKLARGLAQFDPPDWRAMADLFRQFPAVHWHLFGAKEVDAVWSAIPQAFRDEFSSRITVSERVALESTLPNGFAFLALPGVGGSGTTAKHALYEAVPVLVCRDADRDISNMFPEPAPHRDFAELVGLASEWAADPAKRTQYLSQQLANINRRADLVEKSAEMEEILARATQFYAKRIAQ